MSTSSPSRATGVGIDYQSVHLQDPSKDLLHGLHPTAAGSISPDLDQFLPPLDGRNIYEIDPADYLVDRPDLSPEHFEKNLHKILKLMRKHLGKEFDQTLLGLDIRQVHLASLFDHANQLAQDVSLRKAWARMQPRLVHLKPPSVDSSAKEIRSWLIEHQRTLETLDCFKALDLSGLKLLAIPNQVSFFTQLEELILDNNHIRSLSPAVFSNLKELRRFSIKNNDLKALPARLFVNCTKLWGAAFIDNQIAQIDPNVFEGAVSLEGAYFASNCLISLPPELFRSCPLLEDAFFEGNQITRIPKSLFQRCEGIKQMVFHSNRLREDPGITFPRPLRVAEAASNRMSFPSLISVFVTHFKQHPVQAVTDCFFEPVKDCCVTM
jgi:hypothetical protein